jgi:hypothetical protein
MAKTLFFINTKPGNMAGRHRKRDFYIKKTQLAYAYFAAKNASL